MLEQVEQSQRSWQGTIPDTQGRRREVTITFDENVWPGGHRECTNEDMQVDGEFVDYRALVNLFGREETETMFRLAAVEAE